MFKAVSQSFSLKEIFLNLWHNSQKNNFVRETF